MKKLIAIVGTPDHRMIIEDVLTKNLKGGFAIDDPLNDHLPGVFRISPEDFVKNVPFEPAIITQTHHIRKFLGKLNAGVFAIDRFVGKPLSGPAQTIEFFRHDVADRLLGQDWEINYLIDALEAAKAHGLYLLKDQTLGVIRKLKAILKGDLVFIQAIGEEELVIQGAITIPIKNKAKAKREINELVIKLTEVKRK